MLVCGREGRSNGFAPHQSNLYTIPLLVGTVINRQFSQIMKNYIGIGAALGAGIGTAIGVALHSTAIGIAVGVAVGIVFAAALNPHRKGKQ
jgi:hypothetical protein